MLYLETGMYFDFVVLGVTPLTLAKTWSTASAIALAQSQCTTFGSLCRLCCSPGTGSSTDHRYSINTLFAGLRLGAVHSIAPQAAAHPTVPLEGAYLYISTVPISASWRGTPADE